MADKLLLTPEEILDALNIPRDSKHYKYAKEQLAWATVGAEAQLAKVQPEIDKLKEESEARREVIRRLTERCEQLSGEVEKAKKQIEAHGDICFNTGIAEGKIQERERIANHLELLLQHSPLRSVSLRRELGHYTQSLKEGK